MSNRSKKAALEALRARRNGLLTSSRTDEYETQDAGDIYDVLEEDDYQDLVDRRREREDFVVDDGTFHSIVYSFDSVLENLVYLTLYVSLSID